MAELAIAFVEFCGNYYVRAVCLADRSIDDIPTRELDDMKDAVREVWALASFLDNRPADAFCFSLAEAEQDMRARRDAERKTPCSCGIAAARIGRQSPGGSRVKRTTRNPTGGPSATPWTRPTSSARQRTSAGRKATGSPDSPLDAKPTPPRPSAANSDWKPRKFRWAMRPPT